MRNARSVLCGSRAGVLLVIGGGMMLTLTALATGQTRPGRAQDEQKSAVAGLSPKIREALDRAGTVYVKPLTGAQWSEVNELTGTKHTLYQVHGKNARGNKIEVEITSAGRIIEVEEHGIPLSEVPESVLKTFQAKLPVFKLKKVEAIYQNQLPQPVAFGFEGQDTTGKEVELYISADGKTILN